MRLGIDIGGTFTDLSVIDEATGQMVTYKTPTNPADVASSVAHALDELDSHGVAPTDISYFVHGTTLGLNSLLQRTGAETALLVTEGFRDVLELARLRLPVPFSFYSTRPTPLIPRERVIAVSERKRADGSTEVALADDEIERVVDMVAALEVDAVAICLLHAYAAPEHEHALKRALEEHDNTLYVCCSSEIWPEMREYERTLVTVINAYVGPRLTHYVRRLHEILSERGVVARPYLTRSGGGVMTTETASRESVHTLLSGPAAGVVGAGHVATAAGLSDLVTFDMGGTSADVAIVEGGIIARSTDEEISGFPVIVPAVAISTVGAGGGSIARVDAAGILEVGPQSAGAEPGPACYGLGGESPTVTDAFLLAGFLNPHRFAGKGSLNIAAARAAMDRIAGPLRFTTEATANGVIEVVLANMAGALRGALDRRGIDPRVFTLVAFGGAGPVMACMLAAEVGITSVLVPRAPGTLCALGALTSDFASDFVRTVNRRLVAGADAIELDATVANLVAQGQAWLDREAPAEARQEISGSADLRYVGQSYQLEVSLGGLDPHVRWDGVGSRFHALHEHHFGQSDATAPLELVNLRLRARGQLAPPTVARAVGDAESASDPTSQRVVIIRGRDHRATVYDRAALISGAALTGPAIIEQTDTTVVLPPRWSARVDTLGNLAAQAEV